MSKLAEINYLIFSADLMDSTSNGASQHAPAKRFCSQWTQTECTFPSALPEEVEKILSGYFSFKENQSNQQKAFIVPASSVISSTQQVSLKFSK